MIIMGMFTISGAQRQFQPIIQTDDRVERIAFDNELELLKWFFKSNITMRRNNYGNTFK